MKKLLLFLFLLPQLLTACASNYQAPPAAIPSVSPTTIATATKAVKPVVDRKINKVATKTPESVVGFKLPPKVLG